MPALLYSDPIAHSAEVGMESNGWDIKGVSTHLGLLYLIHRASDAKAEAWSFPSSKITEAEWIVETPNQQLGQSSEFYDSPYGRTGLRFDAGTVPAARSSDRDPHRGISGLNVAFRDVSIGSRAQPSTTSSAPSSLPLASTNRPLRDLFAPSVNLPPTQDETLGVRTRAMSKKRADESEK